MGSAFAPSAVVRRVQSAISERIVSETLVLEPYTDRYVWLNETGARLWELLERPVAVEELSAALVRDWGLASERAQRDVSVFLEALAERGLVELARP